MRLDIGTINIPSSGTRVQLSSDGGLNTTDRLLYAEFTPREGNTGEVYVGIGDVTATHGRELEPEGENNKKGFLKLEPHKVGATIPAGDISFDADTNGNKIDWVVFIKD
jgi:hypothetical protein